MLRYSFASPRDAIGSTIKKLGRPRPSHPLKVLGDDGAVSPDGTPHLPAHVPRKFCVNFSVVWLRGERKPNALVFQIFEHCEKHN